MNWVHGGSMLLSLNRYERKKNVALALRTLREVIDRHALSVGACARARLVIAGGHDPRVQENVSHLRELRALAEELDLEDRVVFLTNVTERQRCASVLRAPRMPPSTLQPCVWAAASVGLPRDRSCGRWGVPPGITGPHLFAAAASH